MASPLRFDRTYELIVQPANRPAISISPPIRCSYTITKSISGGLNSATIRVYNLSQDNRLSLAKDAEQFERRIPIMLRIGYADQLQLIFKGSVHRGLNSREGPDLITELQSLDGGFDFLNSFTAKTVVGKTTAIDAILSDAPNTTRGKITEQPQLVRPKVLVGPSLKLVDELVHADETWYIDDEQLHIIKDDEVTSTYIPLVDAGTGLLNTPAREMSRITFETLINPTLRIGALCQLVSVSAPHLSGVYKIDTIRYNGDNYGSQWAQTCTGLLKTEYKTL